MKTLLELDWPDARKLRQLLVWVLGSSHGFEIPYELQRTCHRIIRMIDTDGH